MGKYRDFQNKLNKYLGDIYKISDSAVRVIRSNSIYQDKSSRQICLDLIQQNTNLVKEIESVKRHIARNIEVINFLASCTDETFIQITKPYIEIPEDRIIQN